MLSEKYLTQHVKKSREFFAFAHCHYLCRCTLYNITCMLLHSEYKNQYTYIVNTTSSIFSRRMSEI